MGTKETKKTMVPPLPKPTGINKKNLQVDVSRDLIEITKKSAKKKNVRLNKIVEWGMVAWLLREDPEAGGLALALLDVKATD